MNLQAEAHKGLLFITSFPVKTEVRQCRQNPSSALEGSLMRITDAILHLYQLQTLPGPAG